MRCTTTMLEVKYQHYNDEYMIADMLKDIEDIFISMVKNTISGEYYVCITCIAKSVDKAEPICQKVIEVFDKNKIRWCKTTTTLLFNEDMVYVELPIYNGKEN